MIEFNRSQTLHDGVAEHVPIKIVGLGGAGLNVIDRVVLDSAAPGADLVVMNTDVQSLTSSVASQKVQIGRTATRGLGAGGDPEIGLAAAEESAEEIRKALAGASLVFLCVGLGGGTGSGAAPYVASLAREHGSLVVVLATMPFSFEGKRRGKQAAEALAPLEAIADAVICFDNDVMGDAVSPKAGIHQAFAAADETISQCIRAISVLFTQPGILHIGFDELCAALRPSARGVGRCIFGYGEAGGDNRAHEALEQALRNPLMDRGRMLEEAHNLLVNVSGGPDMTLNEVQMLMDALGKHIAESTQILFGAAVDARMSGRMAVTILSSTEIGSLAGVAPQALPNLSPKPAPVIAPRVERSQESTPPRPAMEGPAHLSAPAPAPAAVKETPRVEEEEAPLPSTALEEEEEELAPAALLEPEMLPEPAAPPVEKELPATAPSAAPAAPPAPSRPPRAPRQPRILTTEQELLPVAGAREERQETLQFEPVTRGRFEKSEPTIVDGQDLDVPTFLRRNIKVN